MISQYAQVILVEVQCRCVIICLLRKWLRLKPLRRIIAKTISKALIDQTNNWPIETYRPSDRGQATHPKTVRLQQSKQLIWAQSDLTKEWLTGHKNKYKHRQRFRIGQRFELKAKGLEPARGQESTTEPLKIQEVQKVDVRR